MSTPASLHSLFSPSPPPPIGYVSASKERDGVLYTSSNEIAKEFEYSWSVLTRQALTCRLILVCFYDLVPRTVLTCRPNWSWLYGLLRGIVSLLFMDPRLHERQKTSAGLLCRQGNRGAVNQLRGCNCDLLRARNLRPVNTPDQFWGSGCCKCLHAGCL